MRKYQQLLLLLISCASIAVLLIYRSENTRLKDVLQMVNFFGRKDVLLVENITKYRPINEHHFAYPLPIWQLISGTFFAYSAFWTENKLMAGGDAVVLVIATSPAVVNFRCALKFEGSVGNVQGKFTFQRIGSENSEFSSYLFFCKVSRNFGEPKGVTFNEEASKTPSKMLRLRSTLMRNIVPVPMSICLNLVSDQVNSFSNNSMSLLQFMLHHQALGIDDFLLYNGHEIPPTILDKIQSLNARLNLLPFNFPFEIVNNVENQESLRKIVQADCLLRNLNNARYTTLLAANEFFIPNAHITQPNSVVSTLKHYETQLTHFELPLFAVCISSKETLLIDNQMYDPESHFKHFIYILRPHVPLETTSTAVGRVALPLSQALAHRYINCSNIGPDGLHQWNSGLREDFMIHLKAIRMKVLNQLNVFV